MDINSDYKILDLDTPESDPTPSRRKFLRWSINAIGAGVTVALAAPVAGYFISPAFQSEGAEAKVAVGKVSDLSNQTQIKTVLLRDVEYTDSFKKATITKKVFVRATKSNASTAEDFLVIDSVCTHAGCSVDYVKSQDDIYCACHGSHFDTSGKNVSGPAPRPLARYKVSIENGEIMINALKTI